MNFLEIIKVTKDIWCTPAVYSVYHISNFEGRAVPFL